MNTASTPAAGFVRLSVVLRVKWRAVTNTRPARYIVDARGFRPVSSTADSPDAPGYPNTAQWAAERFITHYALPWRIVAGGPMPDSGDYVFIVEAKQ